MSWDEMRWNATEKDRNRQREHCCNWIKKNSLFIFSSAITAKCNQAHSTRKNLKCHIVLHCWVLYNICMLVIYTYIYSYIYVCVYVSLGMPMHVCLHETLIILIKYLTQLRVYIVGPQIPNGKWWMKSGTRKTSNR